MQAAGRRGGEARDAARPGGRRGSGRAAPVTAGSEQRRPRPVPSSSAAGSAVMGPVAVLHARGSRRRSGGRSTAGRPATAGRRSPSRPAAAPRARAPGRGAPAGPRALRPAGLAAQRRSLVEQRDDLACPARRSGRGSGRARARRRRARRRSAGGSRAPSPVPSALTRRPPGAPTAHADAPRATPRDGRASRRPRGHVVADHDPSAVGSTQRSRPPACFLSVPVAASTASAG